MMFGVRCMSGVSELHKPRLTLLFRLRPRYHLNPLQTANMAILFHRSNRQPPSKKMNQLLYTKWTPDFAWQKSSNFWRYRQPADRTHKVEGVLQGGTNVILRIKLSVVCPPFAIGAQTDTTTEPERMNTQNAYVRINRNVLHQHPALSSNLTLSPNLTLKTPH